MYRRAFINNMIGNETVYIYIKTLITKHLRERKSRGDETVT